MKAMAKMVVGSPTPIFDASQARLAILSNNTGKGKALIDYFNA